MSLGLKLAGLRPRLAVDVDAGCIATYRRNFRRAQAWQVSVSSLDLDEIRQSVSSSENYVLVGCPPCQLFSRLHRKVPDGDHVIFAYFELIQRLRAPYLIFENVPQIRKYEWVWNEFMKILEEMGYQTWVGIVNAADLGVPQLRYRLVLIASLLGKVEPVFHRDEHRTVGEAIRDLPEASDSIPNHASMRLSDQNRLRIESIKVPGGVSRRASAFSDSYARMHWDRPAPTITTRYISFSNGRFGHPQYNRALTVREGARLQGFPDDFVFCGGLWSEVRQVGNAVPPPLAYWLGRTIVDYERKLSALR